MCNFLSVPNMNEFWYKNQWKNNIKRPFENFKQIFIKHNSSIIRLILHFIPKWTRFFIPWSSLPPVKFVKTSTEPYSDFYPNDSRMLVKKIQIHIPEGIRKIKDLHYYKSLLFFWKSHDVKTKWNKLFIKFMIF